VRIVARKATVHLGHHSEANTVMIASVLSSRRIRDPDAATPAAPSPERHKPGSTREPGSSRGCGRTRSASRRRRRSPLGPYEVGLASELRRRVPPIVEQIDSLRARV
jgi:hypothetical protein